MTDEIRILSATDDEDYVFGTSTIQYQKGTEIGFVFSDHEYKEVFKNPSLIENEICDNKLHWSDLSNDALELAEESMFDMLFIEWDDEEWTDERCELVHDEIPGCIEWGDDPKLTVYSGAMCNINWSGHPKYGKPYFEKKPEVVAG